MDLTGKAALVTGGGTGLGQAIVLALAAEGCDLVVNYPGADRAEAESTAQEAMARGVRAVALQADVSQADQVARMVEQAVEYLGRIDLLVNNAGTTVIVPFPDLDAIREEDWDRILAVNVKGAFLCARAVAPHMRAQKGGRIVNVASTAGLWPSGSSIPYSVSKSALMGLTRCLAVALAPDILVNAVAPGFMLTRWGRRLAADGGQEYAQRALTKHIIQVSEVADAALGLMRNDSITGQTLVIDGGAMLR
jgi:3-oxoacyl-[acyl-carrier protein] reductase